MGVYNDLIFTEALEQTLVLIKTDNMDEVADRIEQVAKDPDLAMACLMLLYMSAKGVDISEMNGVELANTKPTIASLVFPPGVNL